MCELEEVFEIKKEGKGKTLRAYLLIAQGERDAGTAILKEFIDETQKKLGLG